MDGNIDCIVYILLNTINCIQLALKQTVYLLSKERPKRLWRPPSLLFNEYLSPFGGKAAEAWSCSLTST